MKNIKILLAISLALTCALPVTARCEGITVTLDGKPLEFDVPPQIIDGRTLVPMRAIFEAMGAEVEWYEETRTVKAIRMGAKENTTVTMQIGNNTLTKEIWDIKYDSEPHIDLYGYTDTAELDVPPQIIDDRTLVPARAVAESFGAKVDWDGDTQTVIIVSAKDETPAPTAAPETDFPVQYDNSLEAAAGYMKDFEILSLEKNGNGDYDISYTLQTYLEGRGDVAVSFNCFDDGGSVVDSWSRLYRGTDYTWSRHTDAVTVSGKTVKIQLAR